MKNIFNFFFRSSIAKKAHCGPLFVGKWIMSDSLEIDQAKKYIYAFDLSGIIEKLIHREGWLRSDAIETSNLYRDFLFLVKKYGPMAPSQDIDDFWHHHLLNSPHYWRTTQDLQLKIIILWMAVPRKVARLLQRIGSIPYKMKFAI